MRSEAEILCQVLQEEVVLLGDLVSTQGRERDSLVRLDTPPFTAALTKTEAILERLSLAEQAREALTRRLGEKLGIGVNDLDARAIAIRVDEPVRGRLLGLRRDLQGKARELARLNELNQALTLQAMDHTEFLLAILVGGEGQMTYTRAGAEEKKAPVPRSLIDRVV